MDYFSSIPVFIAVVETGSFSEAAKALNVSKSAVSKRINGLEAKLNVRLLHRTTRRISLTEAGETYYEFAKASYQSAKDAEDAVSVILQEPSGTLKVQAPMSFGIVQLSKLTPAFLKQYPKVHLDLSLNDNPIDLLERGIDVAFFVGELADSNLIARPLMKLGSVVCASPKYIQQYGLPESPESLGQHNCILYSYSPGKNRWYFHKDDKEIDISVTGNYRVNNSEALKQTVLQDLGVARLPSFLAGEHIQAGDLINVFPDYQMPNYWLYLLYPERKFLSKKSRVFIDFCIEHFSE